MKRVVSCVIVVAGILLGCTQPGTPNQSKIIDLANSVHNLTSINSVGNTLNGGLFYLENETVYGNIHGNLVKVNAEGMQHILLKDINPTNIVFFEDWVYFIDQQGRLSRIDLHTNLVEELIDDADLAVTCFYLYDGHIYYQASFLKTEGFQIVNQCPQIYRMSPDGSNKEVIFTNNNPEREISKRFSIGYGFLFIPINEVGLLTISLLDGAEKDYTPNILEQCENLGIMSEVIPIENFAYFTGQQFHDVYERPVSLFRLDLITDEISVIHSGGVGSFTNGDGSLYFSAYEDESDCIIELDTSNNKEKCIIDTFIPKIIILGEYFYFRNGELADNSAYRININSGVREQFP